MPSTIVFDLNGTLLDLSALDAPFAGLAKPGAPERPGAGVTVCAFVRTATIQENKRC